MAVGVTVLGESTTVPRAEERTPGAEPVRLNMLGGFELLRGGEQVDLQPGAQRLLAYLALHDRPVQRSVVAGTLWFNSTEKKAFASLRTALWRLGRLGCVVASAKGSTVAVAGDVRVDVRETVSAAKRILHGTAGGQSARFESVAQLTEDLLPEWWEDWVLLERERLRQLRLHALERLATQLAANGRWAEALEAGLAAVAAEPLRESASRLIVEIHLAEGNVSEALRHYSAFGSLLGRELGLAPSPRIQQLVEPLLSTPVPPPTPPARVPRRARFQREP